MAMRLAPALAAAIACSIVAAPVPGVIAANLDVGTLTTPLVATGFFMAMAGGLLFDARLTAYVRPTTDLAGLRADLEQLAAELLVDLSLDA